jgi:RNA polymerase sigma-70 factor (ECF subfamily)
MEREAGMDGAVVGAGEAMRLAIEHRGMIETYAFAITRDPHLVEDVRQEVALVLAGHPERIPDGAGRIQWLKEVVRRKSLELLRRHARGARLLSSEALDRIEAAIPSEADPAGGLALLMAACVDKLGGDARLAIIGRYGEHLDVPGIAARLGRSVQGTYAVLKRARLALEDCVARASGRQEAT